MRFVIPFGLVAAACLLGAWFWENAVGRLLLLNTALSAGVVSGGYAAGWTGLFGKRPDGRIAFLARLVHWPYFAVNAFYQILVRRFSAEPAHCEILPGLFIGRCHGGGEARELVRRGLGGVADLTCELWEARAFREAPGYLLLPVLDTYPPTAEQFETGAEHVLGCMKKGGVLVHCAAGHGRSAALVAAALLRGGYAESPEAALEMIREKRPKCRFHRRQMAALRRFNATLKNEADAAAPRT